MTNEQKQKLAAEIMMGGNYEGLSMAAAEVLTLYITLCKRSDIAAGSETTLVLATLKAFELSHTLHSIATPQQQKENAEYLAGLEALRKSSTY